MLQSHVRAAAYRLTSRPFGYDHERMEIKERPTETLLTITPVAAAKIRELMAEEPDGDTMVLRVAIQGGGCSGFQYGLGFDTEPAEGDQELVLEGVNVVVDPFSVPYLQGATIDFLTGLQESGLQDRQPERRLLVRLWPLLPGGRGCRGRACPGRPRRRLRLRLLALSSAPRLALDGVRRRLMQSRVGTILVT